MLASAEGASGEKDEFCAKVLLNSCASLKVLKTGGILKMLYKYARFVHLQNQENGARERRRRERRKFGAFYTRFTQKCFLYPSACQRVLKNRSFFENVQRTSALCAPPEPRENGARERRRPSGENLKHSTRVLRKNASYTTLLGTKCTKNTQYF